jgi:hypothetical protein
MGKKVFCAAAEKNVMDAMGRSPKHIQKAVDALNAVVMKYAEESKRLDADKTGVRELIGRAKARPGCTCPKPPPPLLPSPPCDVFFSRPPPGPARRVEYQAIADKFSSYKADHVGREPTPRSLIGVREGDSIMHLTPKSAGGCPTGDGNLQSKKALCPTCQAIDDEFNYFQS